MTTQREPDTSAEGQARKHAESIAAMVIEWVDGGAKLGIDWRSALAEVIEHRLIRLRALADAAGQAAPVPPPVEDREVIIEANNSLYGSQSYFLAMNGGPPNKYHLSEGIEKLKADNGRLAKEVERLKEIYRNLVRNHNSLLVDSARWEAKAKAAEAKLAVYEAPIGDGEVEDAIRGLGIVRDLIKSKRKHLLGGKFSGLDAALTMLEADAALFRRLSAAHAECKGENTKPSPPWTMRLARIDQRTAIERQASDLKAAIEALGAHPLLTDALRAADLAMCTLGQWHDEGEPGGNRA